MSDFLNPGQVDEDYWGIGQPETLIAIKPRGTPTPSPEPNERPVSPPEPQSGENAKRRRKAAAGKGVEHLLRTAYPNHPEVSRNEQVVIQSDDESMADVADMDEKLSRKMLGKSTPEEEMSEQELSSDDEGRSPGDVREEEMVDADSILDEEDYRRGGSHDDDDSTTEDLQKTAGDAMRQLNMNSPPQQPTPIDSGITRSGRPSEAGLGIYTGHDSMTSPQLPMTPLEPSSGDPFHTYQPFGRQHSIGSPHEKLPAIQGPASPEGPASPQSISILPPVTDLLDVADKTNEVNRQRQASMSSMAAPSPLPNGGYRASFSGAHPSPSMLNEHTSPRSTLALSPPSGMLRRESYPMTSASMHDNLSQKDMTSPTTLPTPQSDHRPSIDINSRTLPPIAGVRAGSISINAIPPLATGGYKCHFEGCTAAPFQTPYLLASHANVHSTSRPHYCPVPGCPRGETGRGFKRKNEMIRHGLVHDSPGYICPFCPDREHKYPRPDNLQRHVRVHHKDKNRDDPVLREVLAQRPELGGPIAGRGRRRRMP